VDGLHRVHFIKTKKPNVFTPKEMMITCYNIFELRSYEDCMVSDIFIIDLANATFSDVNKITPSLLAKSLLVYKVKKQNKTCSAMTQRFWPTGSVFASTEGHPLRQQPILHLNIDEDVQSCGQTENFRTSEYT
jgi:hypothetical protein